MEFRGENYRLLQTAGSDKEAADIMARELAELSSILSDLGQSFHKGGKQRRAWIMYLASAAILNAACEIDRAGRE